MAVEVKGVRSDHEDWKYQIKTTNLWNENRKRTCWLCKMCPHESAADKTFIEEENGTGSSPGNSTTGLRM